VNQEAQLKEVGHKFSVTQCHWTLSLSTQLHDFNSTAMK